MPVEGYTKDVLLKELDKFKEAVNNCDSNTPILALDVSKNIEIAFSLHRIDATELAKIHRAAFIEASAFEHSCNCQKK